MTWLAGKKTYIMAGVLIMIGIYCVLDQDASNDAMGLSFISVALGLMGLHAQADRHHAEQVALVAQIAKQVATGKAASAEQKSQLVAAGMEIAGEVVAASAPPPKLPPAGGQ